MNEFLIAVSLLCQHSGIKCRHDLIACIDAKIKQELKKQEKEWDDFFLNEQKRIKICNSKVGALDWCDSAQSTYGRLNDGSTLSPSYFQSGDNRSQYIEKCAKGMELL